MNPESLKVLAERASTIEGRSDERLDEVHARIGRARRRRQGGAVIAAVVAVVLALTAGVGVLALTDTDPVPPAKPAPVPTPRPKPPGEEKPVARKVTYAKGQTIHWGDRTIDVGGKVWDLEATDDGVVFSRDRRSMGNTCSFHGEACGDLWFTDGSDVTRIGRATGSVVRGYDIEFSTSGSTVVWSEPDPEDHSRNYPRRGEYVVYDTQARRETGRFGSARSHVVAVLDDSVYWLPDETWCGTDSFYEQCPRLRSVMRFDVSTGAQQRVTWAAYVADRRSRPRTFITPNTEHALWPGPVLSSGLDFLRDENRLVPDDGNGGTFVARIAASGEPVQLTVADRYTDLDWFPKFMWLDDDLLALTADRGDILVCRLPGGRCRTAVTGSPLTSFHGRG